MTKLNEAQKSRINAFALEYAEKYLNTEDGRKHLQSFDRERSDVREIFQKTREKFGRGEDITEDVLRHLLPHSNTKNVRSKGYRVSTWPAITKDVKLWFERAGWQKSENWPKVAESIFRLIDGILTEKNDRPIREFLRSQYSKGFQAGMISPILYCLDSSLLVINSKTVDTINYLSETDVIDSRLENYLENTRKVDDFLRDANVSIFDSYDRFDAFCHWMCSKRLGGYARMEKEIEEQPKSDERMDVSGLSQWDVVRKRRGTKFVESLGTANRLLDMRLYDQAIREYGSITERLLKQLYQNYFPNLPIQLKEKILNYERESKMATNKFTMGQWIGLFRSADLFRYIAQDKKGKGESFVFFVPSILNALNKLRNQSTHRTTDYENYINEYSAFFAKSAILCILRELGE